MSTIFKRTKILATLGPATSTPEKVNEESRWILETPKDIRADAVFAARQHLTTGMKQIKNKSIKHFKVKYQKKKHPTWSISVPKTAIKMVKDKKTNNKS